jgi:tetratricopeptide (TPR) repeat protein
MVDAVATYEWAIQLWQTAPEPDAAALTRLYRHIGEIARYWRGRVERLDTYLAEALHLLDQDPTQAESLERARVLATMALNLYARPEMQSNDEEALNLARTAAGMAARLNATTEEAMALDVLQRIYRAQGNLAAAHEVDRRRLELIPRIEEPTEIVEAHLGASQMSWETSDLAAATRSCLEALAVAKRTDNIGGQWEALRRLVILHLQWGKLSTAVTYANQGVALGPRAGLLEFGEPVEAIFRTHLAILYTLQGQAEEAAGELAELSLLYPTPEAPPYHFALGWLHYEVETWDEAVLNLENGQPFPTPFLPSRFDQVLLFEAYAHLGDEAALAGIGSAAEAEARRWNLPYLMAILQRGYGVFYSEQANWTEAEAAFKRALAVTRGKPLLYQDARTWLDYARMLIRRNEADDADLARDFLSEARSMFIAFGAHALAEKAWIEVARLAQ